jgi:small multidrug resistance family-3 protein
VFGYVVDGFKPDVGDVVGASVALAGVLIIMLYPRAT